MSTDNTSLYRNGIKTRNYWWATVSGLGVYFINGLSSYLQFDLLPVIHSQNIVFSTRPCYVFLWILGLLFSFYLGLTILWSVERVLMNLINNKE
jgi:hypothetical protein